MKLYEWMEKAKINADSLAGMLVVRRSTVDRYVNRGRVPTPRVMKKIVGITGGQVTPNDFYALGKRTTGRR
jgi:transcriptional regulator with XRE-family HTH domain